MKALIFLTTAVSGLTIAAYWLAYSEFMFLMGLFIKFNGGE